MFRRLSGGKRFARLVAENWYLRSPDILAFQIGLTAHDWTASMAEGLRATGCNELQDRMALKG